MSETESSRRLQGAIERANDRASHALIAQLENTIRTLEHEVDERSGELLELKAAFAAPGMRHRASRSASPEFDEVCALFKALRERRGNAPSLVTVIIPVYGKINYTLRCLRSIALTWSFSVNPTIVVVDDASPDNSVRDLVGIPGVDVLHNGTNLGYLRSTNRGAAFSKTKYTCFLNNDTEVRNAWLDVLVQAAENDDSIGAVGSKLIYPDGTLQEAGSIIWSDASGWNYGRGDDPGKSEYNIPRDVDYCSAASLLIRTDLLREIGGFDERYAPAYYEDADLCFEVASRGYRVVYEPRSEVIHYEGVSSGTSVASGVKRYQEINRPKFAEKWESRLATQLSPSSDNVAAAVRRAGAKTILIVDSYVPHHDREAGSNRLFKIVKILRDLMYHVLFLPANGVPIEPYSSDLVRLGVEVLYLRGGLKDMESVLASVMRRVDLAWICRPELCQRFIPIVRDGSHAPIVYDTIDLHFAREKRRFELEGGDETVWQELKDTELAMAHAADLVVTVTELERGTLGEYGIDRVAVIPTIHDVEPHESFDFAVRSGLIFIGGYGHTPNVDAALWLCNEIMPIVWRTNPGIGVTLLGNQPPLSVQRLRSDRVTVTGFVPDVTAFFEEARLFVAPLRYGAGMKGKVGQALSYGLPVITTSVGAEGYELSNDENCIIADDAQSFAAAIVRLYDDRDRWIRFSAGGIEALRPLGAEAVRTSIRELFRSLGVGTSD